MSHKPTRAEFEANVRMKGEGPSKADLAKLYPDLFGSKTKKKKPAAKAKKKTKLTCHILHSPGWYDNTAG